MNELGQPSDGQHPILDSLDGALTPLEVAERLRRTRAGVMSLIHRGVSINRRKVKLAAVLVGREYLITREALESFLAQCNPTPHPTPKAESPSARDRRARAGQSALARRLGQEVPP